MKFKELGVIAPILRALEEKGYETPTDIQVQAIPEVLKGKDILGCAQTGTGKTAAFALPIIQKIYEGSKGAKGKPEILSLIVTPTRELAIQIDENIAGYAKYCNLKHTVIFGGVGQVPQVDKLRRGVHILTATPGRLLDLIDQGEVDLGRIELFVLDEADRMLDMGFINDIKKLLKLVPQKKQSLFFSATMPGSIQQLAGSILKNPVKVEVTPVSSTAETIDQYLYYTNKNLKQELLFHIIKERGIEQALIFTRTKHGADRVARNLKKKGFSAMSIHGDKAQKQRQKSLTLFKEGKLNALVATNIAARGIDIDKLMYVINYEIPNEPEAYVHRIGRSGRAGEDGIAISIVEPEENVYIKGIERLTNTKINVVKDHPFPQTDKPMTETEKKEWEKEKQRRKQEYFANRNKSRNRGQGNSRGQDANRRQKRKGKSTGDASAPQNDSSANNANKKRSKRKKNNTSARSGSTHSDAIERNRSRFKWPLEK